MILQSYEAIPISEFKNSSLVSCVDLASSASGGKIIGFSDEFFAEANNLINPNPSITQPGRFTENGAWFDGWETRRHNPNFDWVIIRLGFAGVIRGFDLDTAHFNGNEAPGASIEGCFAPYWAQGEQESHNTEWTELLPKVKLGPSSQHFFSLTNDGPEDERVWTHVRIKIYPDGGLARCRVYGHVRPIWPKDLGELVDLAYIGNGGRAVEVSDQHFGRGVNLLLPGRGVNMGDGWETKRSRTPNHCDHVTIRLGERGRLFHAVIDTYHFKGNYPDSVLLQACLSKSEIPPLDTIWTPISDIVKPGPHALHNVNLTQSKEIFSHVRITIFPDGGIKRLRIYGLRDVTGAPEFPNLSSFTVTSETLMAEPLTPASFASYGDVISSTSSSSLITSANQNTASKINHVAKVVNLRQSGDPNLTLTPATPNLCVYRCLPEKSIPVKPRVLERHLYSSQMFVPMDGASAEGYLVIVALNGSDDKPDPTTIRAFHCPSTQGISYNAGTWHHPMIALGKVTDFMVLVHESGVATEDCEEVSWESIKGDVTIEVPGLV